jgi:hypothetical protein
MRTLMHKICKNVPLSNAAGSPELKFQGNFEVYIFFFGLYHGTRKTKSTESWGNFPPIKEEK